MERVVVNGTPLAVRQAGRGPALVLLHGSLNDLRAFDAQVDAFAASYRVVAVSLRHCWPDVWDGRGDDFTVATHADDVAALIGALELAPAHVLGHSRGGAVAIDLALRQPHCIRSLVLADPGGLEALLPDTPEGRALAAQTAAMFARLRDDLAGGDAVAAARRFADTLGGPGTWDRRTDAERAIVLDNIATGPHCAERPRFATADLASLAVPLLLVTGERSPARYRPMLEALARCNDRARALVTIPGAAHAMNREQPAAFNAAVLDFLRTA
jgi:esterase